MSLFPGAGASYGPWRFCLPLFCTATAPAPGGGGGPPPEPRIWITGSGWLLFRCREQIHHLLLVQPLLLHVLAHLLAVGAHHHHLLRNQGRIG